MSIDSYWMLILFLKKNVQDSSYLADLVSEWPIPSAKSFIKILHVIRFRRILWAEMLLLKYWPSKTMVWVEFSYSCCLVFTVGYVDSMPLLFLWNVTGGNFKNLSKLYLYHIYWFFPFCLQTMYSNHATNMWQHQNLKLLHSLHLWYQCYHLCCPCTELMSETRALNKMSKKEMLIKAQYSLIENQDFHTKI